jgi:excisionase family DNA binding protein
LLFCGVPEYRIGQAAELLGVSADTVRRWTDAGRLKVRQASGGTRYVDGVDLGCLAVEFAGEPGRDRPRAVGPQSFSTRCPAVSRWWGTRPREV